MKKSKDCKPIYEYQFRLRDGSIVSVRALDLDTAEKIIFRDQLSAPAAVIGCSPAEAELPETYS